MILPRVPQSSIAGYFQFHLQCELPCRFARAVTYGLQLFSNPLKLLDLWALSKKKANQATNNGQKRKISGRCKPKAKTKNLELSTETSQPIVASLEYELPYQLVNLLTRQLTPIFAALMNLQVLLDAYKNNPRLFSLADRITLSQPQQIFCKNLHGSSPAF